MRSTFSLVSQNIRELNKAFIYSVVICEDKNLVSDKCGQPGQYIHGFIGNQNQRIFLHTDPQMQA